MVPRIKVQMFPNPNIRDYNITIEISQCPFEKFLRPLRDTSEKYLERVGMVGAQLLKEVFALPGVNEVYIKPYELSITKGDAFGWEDIEPGVIEVLKKTFGEETPEIIGATYLPAPAEVVSPREAVAEVPVEVPTKGFFLRVLNSMKEYLQRLLD